MQGTVILRAGTPNDENRDYLPEAIKGSDLVVNENGNNSQPYPERLVECTGTLTEDGLSDRWYEYVPESYDGSEPVPLVVGNHGGLMTGWGLSLIHIWNKIISGMLLVNTKPSRPMLIKRLLTISSQILFNRSAMTPQNGRHTRLVMEKSPTTKPAKVMLAPSPTRYFDRMVATM